MSEIAERKVRVVFRKKDAVVVEYRNEDDKLVRAVFPPRDVKFEKDGKSAEISEHVLDLGMPYGVPFGSKLECVSVTGEELEDALHAYGLWTLADIRNNPNAVIGAIKTALGLTYERILNVATTTKENLT